MPTEDMAALPPSIEEVMEEGDEMYARVQIHVGVAKYRVMRGKMGWGKNFENLEFHVREVIPDFWPQREPIYQVRCEYHLENRFGWDPEPWEPHFLYRGTSRELRRRRRLQRRPRPLFRGSCWTWAIPLSERFAGGRKEKKR
jgi:hypothetical protein